MIHIDDGCVDAIFSDHDDLMVGSLQFPRTTLLESAFKSLSKTRKPTNMSDFSISCRGIGRDDESTDDDDDDDNDDDMTLQARAKICLPSIHMVVVCRIVERWDGDEMLVQYF